MNDALVDAMLAEAENRVALHMNEASRVGLADELTRLQARLYFARRDKTDFRGALHLLYAVHRAVNELNAIQAESASMRERCYEAALKETGTAELALRSAAEMYREWTAARFAKDDGGGTGE
jgi:hypothetical protein